MMTVFASYYFSNLWNFLLVAEFGLIC